jgi:low affinity Fe/Cu permease
MPARFFERVSIWATRYSGSSAAFALATGTILIWAVTGPYFDYSNTWQLVINTGTTIVTFLMVFLIQRAQNKDGLAIQLKLNELIAAVRGASNRLINVEDLSEEEVHKLHERYCVLADLVKNRQTKGPISIEDADEKVVCVGVDPTK